MKSDQAQNEVNPATGAVAEKTANDDGIVGDGAVAKKAATSDVAEEVATVNVAEKKVSDGPVSTVNNNNNGVRKPSVPSAKPTPKITESLVRSPRKPAAATPKTPAGI